MRFNNGIIVCFGKNYNVYNTSQPVVTLPITYKGYLSSCGSLNYGYNGHVLQVYPISLNTIQLYGHYNTCNICWLTMGY